MTIEFLIEDSSGKVLLEHLIPKLIGDWGQPHFWRIHGYKGVGKIPKDLKTAGEAKKRILLEQMPRLLRGYRCTPGVDAIVVVLDTDRNHCVAFLKELRSMAEHCGVGNRTMFRLAIEEMEAWYLGDPEALLICYPTARKTVLSNYEQDSVCNTWELLADAIYPGGSSKIRETGWPSAGHLKHQWAAAWGQL